MCPGRHFSCSTLIYIRLRPAMTFYLDQRRSQKGRKSVNKWSTPGRVLIKINDPFAFIFISTLHFGVKLRALRNYTILIVRIKLKDRCRMSNVHLLNCLISLDGMRTKANIKLCARYASGGEERKIIYIINSFSREHRFCFCVVEKKGRFSYYIFLIGVGLNVCRKNLKLF